MGKSTDAVRAVELDEQLVGIRLRQLRLQIGEQGVRTVYVYTRIDGKPYHPQTLSELHPHKGRFDIF